MLNKLPSINLQKNIFPLRRKLIIFFLVCFLLVLISSIYLVIGYRTSTQFFQDFLSQNYNLEKIASKLQLLQFYSETYLSNQLSKDLLNFKQTETEIENLKIKLNIKPEKYTDLIVIIDSILKEAKKTVKLKQQNQNSYLKLHSKLVTDIRLTQKYITRLINQNNKEGNNKFSTIKYYINNIEQKTIILAILSGLLSILFLLYFSFNVTQPLKKIMKNARKISNGNFNISPIQVNTNDELKSISLVFNQMVEDINDLFTELRKKIRVERQLQQEKVENLKMSNLLREAEIKKLQAQINPHFLYNTLNTISQVAILEEADETGKLIKKVAKLLRYNLKQADTLVPVTDEIENIKIYCHIMEIRYGDKVNFELDYPDDIENYFIPCMTIQPLVENAFIHGIGKLKNTQGKINIKLAKKEKHLIIEVKDNGQGITKKETEEIMSSTDTNVSGILNIKERLELYFKEEKKENDLFKIESKPEQGTKITIKVPSTSRR